MAGEYGYRIGSTGALSNGNVDYVTGANIVGFIKVAYAMVAYGQSTGPFRCLFALHFCLRVYLFLSPSK